MKNFNKSTFAKVLNYLLHVISVMVFAATIAAEVTMGLVGLYEMAPETVYFYYYNLMGLTENDAPVFWNIISTAHQMRFWIYGITVAAFVLAIVSLANLMSAAGRRREDDEIHANIINKIPSDIYLLFYVTVFCGAFAVYDEILQWIRFDVHYIPEWLILLFTAIGCVLIEPLMFTGLAVRIKNKTIFKNSICYYMCSFLWKAAKWLYHQCLRFVKFLGELVKNLPLLWRTVLIVTVVSILEFIILIGFYYESDVIIGFWIAGRLIIIPLVIYGALTLRKLETAGQKLADGELSYRLDLKGLYWQFRKHGENLNSISAGMKTAIFKELRSERMKTELITNVSHDIKTPLTSIINYATLINAEVNSEDAADRDKIKEYSEVLVRQSDRLKRLTEDLVEASKASTGNIEVNLEPCDPAVFITQSDGEYAAKLEKAGLTLVTKLPEEEVCIMADGRRMWRVFDNLMNNICKYALEGTRVYLSLEIVNSDAVFTFKNTSRDMLDISEDELMERFVRGDKSRNTEGNGLGLAIAKSMAEVQGGKLDISIDGDLFKAALRFSLAKTIES